MSHVTKHRTGSALLVSLVCLAACGCYNSEGAPLKPTPPPTKEQALSKLPADATPEQKAQVEAQVKMANEMYEKYHPKK